MDPGIQIAPVFAIQNTLDNNNNPDNLIFAGNQTKVRVKLGRLNGNHGIMLKLNQAEKEVIHPTKSGLNVRNDVRDIAYAKSKKGDLLVFPVYNGLTSFYRKKE